jgi:hypothetical protein
MIFSQQLLRIFYITINKRFLAYIYRIFSCTFSLEYCKFSRMAKPSFEKSFYLQTIGNDLHPDIDIFWTGKLPPID